MLRVLDFVVIRKSFVDLLSISETMIVRRSYHPAFTVNAFPINTNEYKHYNLRANLLIIFNYKIFSQTIFRLNTHNMAAINKIRR